MDTWEVEKKEFDDICLKIDDKKFKETSLYNENSYETLLNSLNNSRYFRSRHADEPVTIVDSENGITYEFSRASNHFVFFILNQLKNVEPTNIVRLNIQLRFRHVNGIEKEFIKRFNASTGFKTLKINSNEKMKLKTYENLATSFLFTLSYNLDMSIIELKSLDEFLMPQRDYGRERNPLDKINPPHRRYIPDLVYYYQMALASETVSLKFLSFYHIIEYFFEKVYNDDLLFTVKEKLTAPDFSYKKDKEITKLIKIIQNKTKIRSDTLTFDEKEALKLVLEKYVSLDQLKDNLKDYDSKLIDYYKTKEVSFSHGNKIDFNSSEENTYKNISSRVYQTRNSIVHSKEGDKPKYIPYQHEKQLLHEIPLIKIISEEIIIRSSEILFDSE